MIVVVAMEGSRTLVLSSLRMPFPFRWSHPTDASITVTIEINSSTVNDLINGRGVYIILGV